VASDEARDPRPPRQTQSRALRREPVRGTVDPDGHTRPTDRPAPSDAEPCPQRRKGRVPWPRRADGTPQMPSDAEPCPQTGASKEEPWTQTGTRDPQTDTLGRGTLPSDEDGRVSGLFRRDPALRREPVRENRGPRRAHETHRPTDRPSLDRNRAFRRCRRLSGLHRRGTLPSDASQ